MGGRIHSIIESGMKGTIIDIECHISKGLPAIVIVGFANKAIDEAKERLRGAFTNSDLPLPRKRITINLAPADIPKDGAGFDLAIAMAIMEAAKQYSSLPQDRQVFIGELGLDGSVRAVRGIIGKLLAARRLGHSVFFIPEANMAQACLIPGLTLYPIESLKSAYLHMTRTNPIQPIETKSGAIHTTSSSTDPHDFADIIGQMRAKRALEIAAAGGHNVLLNGPPGTGKSMLAKALPSILPPLSHEEMLEVTHLHSLASHQFDQIIQRRPFRAPHHSASNAAIIGGGQNPRPGEISLSHRGVLFFDEFPEFSRTAIEALRQPLEDRTITVARAKDSIEYPANFLLIATANPCPCGYYGSSHSCQCLPYQVIRYERKLSGPIMDRIDLYVDVEEVEHERLLNNARNEESSDTIRKRIERARQIQYERNTNDQTLNSAMTNADIQNLAKLTTPAQTLLNQAANKLGLSARGYMRSVKVSRTIADLEQAEMIDIPHISEALQYRRQSSDPY